MGVYLKICVGTVCWIVCSGSGVTALLLLPRLHCCYCYSLRTMTKWSFSSAFRSYPRLLGFRTSCWAAVASFCGRKRASRSGRTSRRRAGKKAGSEPVCFSLGQANAKGFGNRCSLPSLQETSRAPHRGGPRCHVLELFRLTSPSCYWHHLSSARR